MFSMCVTKVRTEQFKCSMSRRKLWDDGEGPHKAWSLVSIGNHRKPGQCVGPAPTAPGLSCVLWGFLSSRY